MRRYVAAYPMAASEAPKTRHSGSAASATATLVTAPRPDGQPGAVDPRLERTALAAGPDLAGDDRRRAVGEEDEDVGGGDEGGARDAEARRAARCRGGR